MAIDLTAAARLSELPDWSSPLANDAELVNFLLSDSPGCVDPHFTHQTVDHAALADETAFPEEKRLPLQVRVCGPSSLCESKHGPARCTQHWAAHTPPDMVLSLRMLQGSSTSSSGAQDMSSADLKKARHRAKNREVSSCACRPGVFLTAPSC